MGNVFFLLPHLDDSGWARQVSLLAPALLDRGWTSEVFSVAGDGPLTPELRAAGITVLNLLGRAPKDLRGWLALRWLPPTPDRGLVHVFGLGAFRRLMIARVGRRWPRLVVTLTGREWLTWLDLRWLRRVHRVIVPHGTAATALLARGVPRDRIEVVTPAVALPPELDRAAVRAVFGLPPDTPLAMTVARLDDYHRLSDAVWSFEFIRLAEPSTRLLIVGDGPARPRLGRFSHQIAPEGPNILFAGRQADVPALVAVADAAFVPHRTGGANAALEAMAAGVPVVAANTPDLAAVVRDGAGVLVPTGSPPTAAKELRRFLFDPARRTQFGAAGRQVASREHSVEGLAGRMEAIYGAASRE